MDVSYLLDSLNDKQREAVAASRTNMLVLAGAGSGKTRVLVHRIAWLLSVENCSPYSIMAVTFTNKAAAEMRHRIGQLMGTTQGGMWVGTFHGLAHRLLRAHHLDANLPQDFQILDSEDQLRLLKRLIKAMNLDEKQWPPRQAMWYINSQKDEGLRPHHIQSYGNPVEQTWQKVYQAYQEACDRAGLRIFADDEGKLNRSAVELGYSVLVVSNFTLYGDTSRGKRPSFIHAAKGETAKSAYDAFLQELMNAQGLKDVQHGEFGADMQVSLVNDGPVTIIIDTDEWK